MLALTRKKHTLTLGFSRPGVYSGAAVEIIKSGTIRPEKPTIRFNTINPELVHRHTHTRLSEQGVKEKVRAKPLSRADCEPECCGRSAVTFHILNISYSISVPFFP